MKQCTGCLQEKKESEFYSHTSSPDGLEYRCKICTKEIRNKRYAKRMTKRERAECFERIGDAMLKWNDLFEAIQRDRNPKGGI